MNNVNCLMSENIRAYRILLSRYIYAKFEGVRKILEGEMLRRRRGNDFTGKNKSKRRGIKIFHIFDFEYRVMLTLNWNE